MVLRRRERQVLGALQDLSVYLRGVREERKAVITMTGGWVLFRENPNLTRGGSGESNLPRVGTTPDGRLVSDAHKYTEGYSQHDCEVDRQHLAMLDDWQFFHDMFDIANRSNVTFYPVNALGLVAFDKDLGEDTVAGEIQALGPAAHAGEDPNTVLVNPLVTDSAMISQRSDNLRALAENTDGLAVVDTNDIDKGMKRIVDDLTSSYLLGYTSTNGKLDGRYRKISVRVKRPGVDVRARRGYRAATEKEVEEGRMAQVRQNRLGAADDDAGGAERAGHGAAWHPAAHVGELRDAWRERRRRGKEGARVGAGRARHRRPEAERLGGGRRGGGDAHRG